MLKQSLSKLARLNISQLFTVVNPLEQRQKYRYSRKGQNKLQSYEKIKMKQSKHQSFKSSKYNSQPIQQQIEQLGNFILEKNIAGDKSKKQVNIINASSTSNKYRCNGCNVHLQSEDIKKYGYVKAEVLQDVIKSNAELIRKSYGQKVVSRDIQSLNILHQVEKQSGIKIFNPNSQDIENLDNLEVLMRLQQKIDQYEQSQQFLKRSKSHRKQIYCYRCHSLKFNNRLPQEYDNPQMDPTNSQQFTLNKILNKHPKQDTHYLYLVDVLDIAGSFQFDLFKRLIDGQCKFSIVLNKVDVVNERYLNIGLLRQRIKNRIQEYCSKAKANFSAQQIDIYMMSSRTQAGLKKLKQFLEQGKIKRLQLIGFPNTGKTSLLNALIKEKVTVSNIPGTTTHVTEHTYKNRLKIFDMPGIYSDTLLYNLIQKPNHKALLTWNKFYSPPLLTHNAIFFGGKVQLFGSRIIVFGHGGVASGNNQWFMKNYKQFWKGLPELHQLNIVKHQKTLKFNNGQTQDLQIQGFGFISFRISDRRKVQSTQKLTFYLPKSVKFRFSESVLNSDDKVFHLKDALKRQHMLTRIRKESSTKRISKQN